MENKQTTLVTIWVNERVDKIGGHIVPQVQELQNGYIIST